MTKNLTHIKDFLDDCYLKYNNLDFIENDPIWIPHQFSKKEDIEIAAFLSATIAWGNRKSIITNATRLITWMDNSPHEFILNYTKKDLKPFEKFVHRTFNGVDCIFFLNALKYIYIEHNGLEAAFKNELKEDEFNLKNNIANFRKLFLHTKHLPRSEKHISNPLQKSSSKRLCMFLRWMVRNDNKGIDFGIWKSISAKELCLPLDVHTGNVSRNLGLLNRNQNDWQSVEEITRILRLMDSNDPIKYDFALFGIGVNKLF